MNQIAPEPITEARVTFIQDSHVATTDECELDGPYTITPLHPYIFPISPKLRATLTALGMREEALSAWETFHASPVRAILYCFGSMFTLLCCLCYLQAFGIPFTRYYLTIPQLITFTFIFIYFVSIWRMGPLAARSKPYMYSLPVSWICSFALFAGYFLLSLIHI